MKRSTTICLLLALALALTCLLGACNDNNADKTPLSLADTSGADSAVKQVESAVDLGELSRDTDRTGAVKSANGDVTVSESGSYLFEGDYGKITIAKGELKLHFFFNNANIKCDDGVAIDGADVKGTELTVTLCENSENSVTNGKDNAVHIKGKLFVNGKGSLAVTSTGKNAVKASKEFCIADAKLTLSAKGHAVSAQSITAQNATVTVLSAGKDGLNAECDDETTSFTAQEGFVALKDTAYTCSVQGDGIQADTVVYIDGGTCNITTQGEFVPDTAQNRLEYDLDEDDFRYVKSGENYKKVASDYFSRETMYALKQGCKGIKAGEIKYPDPENSDNEITLLQGDYCIAIKSGDIFVHSTDDAVHANSGSVLIWGGTLQLETSDDGITADVLTRISGGNVTVKDSYEGLEGAFVEITDGTVDVTATDDGINASCDDVAVAEYIAICGGNVTVNAEGDGLDSNGSLYVTGGSVTVFGPTGNGDGGMDSETGIYVDGGTLAVLSSRGMTELPSDKSAQYVIACGGWNVTAGETISVRDAKGKTLWQTVAVKNAQTLIFSCDALLKDGTYGVYNGETKLADIKLTEKISSYGIQGGFGPGGPGGPGTPGGPGGGFGPGKGM